MVTAVFRRKLLRDSPSSVLALAFLGALGCGSDPDTVRLDVLLLTDYRPGIDFVEVRTEVLEEVMASTRVVSDDESFFSPSDVARLEGLTPAQRRRLRVELVRRDGTLLQRSRTVSFAHQRDRQQLTRICAACEEFACPFGQTCECGLEPTCVPDECAEDECTTTSCEADTECRESGLSCVNEVCREGVCLRAPDDAVCATATVCDVVGGECIPDPRPSRLDGGVTSDAGDDVDGGVEGGVDGGVDAGPEPSAPRPLAPLSTSTVTSQRPTLQWELAVGTAGARVELCRDRAMTTGCLAVEEVLADRLRPAAPLAAGWWYWRLRGVSAERESATTSPVWQFRVGPRSADGDVDTSWGSEPDFDGDGFAELVMGARGADADTGEVRIVRIGGGGGEQTLAGATVGGLFGSGVATLGDVNGDGLPDLAVVSPSNRADPETGTVQVFHAGGLELVETTPALTVGGTSVASAGDVDGDGYADVLVAAFRASPGGLGDAGQVRLYRGSAAGLVGEPAWTFDGAAAGDRLGSAIGSAGDVDADGYADVLLGAYFVDGPAGVDAGRAYLFLGSETGLGSEPLVLDGSAAGDWFGNSVRNLGDVNGDGYSDFAVGAFFADPGGRVNAGTLSVYLGGSGVPSIVPFVVHEGAVGDRFGISVNGGDFDGDGFDDLAVSATFADPSGLANAGTAVVYDRVATSRQVLAGNAPSLQFGIGGVADFDGDGRADLAVGARSAAPSGQVNAGSVWVYLGSTTGIVATPAFTFAGSAAGEELGSIAP